MTWDMDLKLDFKPTDSNNLRIYIYKDGVDTVYIQVGNNKQCVSLYEREGTSSAKPRITGRKALLEEPFLFVHVRLTLEEGRIWTLYTRKDNEDDFTKEGTYKMASSPSSPGALMIITCRYVKGRVSEYLIDNPKVTHNTTNTPDPDPDPTPTPDPDPEYTDLKLLSVETPDKNGFQLHFDKLVDISKAVCKIGGAMKATLSYGLTKAIVNVSSSGALENGCQYLVAIDGLYDLNGGRIKEVTCYALYDIDEDDTPSIPVPGIPGQVYISEVMADPVGLTVLPQTEYVELHNTSGTAVSLNGWAFVYDRKKIIIDALSLPGEGYAVLYREGNPIHVDGTGIAAGLGKFPPLANDGRLLQLEDAMGTQMDSLRYPKAKSGVSYERSGEEIYLSTNTRGGTPGSPNSKAQGKGGNEDNTTGISAPVRRKDGLYSIAYLMESKGYRCRMGVYDMVGRRMAEIANFRELDSEGELTWDGRSSSGAYLRTGAYILSVELYHTSGQMEHYGKLFLVK
jgi:hypothetical protein